MNPDQLVSWITSGEGDSFSRIARDIFRYQYSRNSVYRRYCQAIGRTQWEGWTEVPFFPVEGFKHRPVTCFNPDEAEATFLSSGTEGQTPSKHFIRELDLYEWSVESHFREVFGNGPFVLVGHLPRYAEQGAQSSLVYMVEHLVQTFGDDYSGFFLDDPSVLDTAAEAAAATGHQLILFGAAFGLLDLIEERTWDLPSNSIVLETGGMKTYRQSVSREELHDRLSEGFGLPTAKIWSEYGMCELSSQCYTRGNEIFYPPWWMNFVVVDSEDPTRVLSDGETGALAVFDLANVHSLSPLLPGDKAVAQGDGFQLLGRLSESELRGCNFLVERLSKE